MRTKTFFLVLTYRGAIHPWCIRSGFWRVSDYAEIVLGLCLTVGCNISMVIIIEIVIVYWLFLRGILGTVSEYMSVCENYLVQCLTMLCAMAGRPD